MQAPFLSLELEQQPLCLDLSPCSQLLATGLIDGHVTLHTYDFAAASEEEESESGSRAAEPGAGPTTSLRAKLQHTIAAHAAEHSCRALAFLQDGSSFVSGSSDRTLALHDASTARLVRRMDAAHGADVSAVYCPSSNTVASGDEDGGVKMWDLRAKKMVMSYKKHSDFISCFSHHPKEQCLLVSSGDGTLSLHDMRTGKNKLRTEDDADDELLSVAVVKGGRKVIAGTQSGVINIYSWGAMKDCSDRFPGHPESVDAVVKFDEDTVLTGSSDGVVRIISVLPNKLLGLVGEHSELPVECLALAQDRRVLASASHDHTVKLWDMAFLLGGDGDEDEDEEAVEESEGGDVGGVVQGRVLGPVGFGSSGLGSGEGDEPSDEDEDEDEGEEEEDDEGEEEEGGEGEEEGEGEVGEAEEEGEEDEAGEAQAAEGQQEPRASAAAAAGAAGQAPEAATASSKAARRGAAESGKAPAAGKKQDSDDSDNDSDDDEAPKKKRKKGEKTRWRKDPNAKASQAKKNFFSGLLD